MAISSANTGLRAGVCTSTTRPSNPYLGQLIFETDTFVLNFWNGSSWQGAVSAPAGTVQPFAGTTAPTGWLLCGGQAVSRATYANLFAIIGTTYGVGDGSTTFNIPDLRGRTVAGLDNINGTDAGRLDWANTIGTVGGAQTHTLISAEMPSHTHTQDSHNHSQIAHTHIQDAHSHTVIATNGWAPIISNISVGGGGVGYWSWTNVSGSQMVAASTTATNQNATATNNATTATNQNTGGGGSHNNMQPTILLNYMIKF